VYLGNTHMSHTDCTLLFRSERAPCPLQEDKHLQVHVCGTIWVAYISHALEVIAHQ
jgi:hypothetical protein